MKPDLTNYRWPAEWEAHDGTLVAWPINEQTWPGVYERIPTAFSTFVAQLARFEPVWVLAGGPSVTDDARPLIDAACDQAASRFPVQLLDVPVNDSWCRDYGPTVLATSNPVSCESSACLLDWEWNAWGGKYPPWDHDAQVTTRLADQWGLPVIRPGVILEGGAIDGNGCGTILATESCLLNPNRNIGWHREYAEQILHDYLRCQQVIWLPGDGIPGDDTDGHVDQLARFVSEDCVLVAVTADEDVPLAEPLRANVEVIADSHNSNGQSLELVILPLPQAICEQLLPMSYCNFYIVNGGVIVPTFRDPADDVALQTIQDRFPDRTVVGVNARDIVHGLGSWHCLSQQLPQGTVATP